MQHGDVLVAVLHTEAEFKVELDDILLAVCPIAETQSATW